MHPVSVANQLRVRGVLPHLRQSMVQQVSTNSEDKMTKIYCRTSIDCARNLVWPIELPETPQIGDYIVSLSSTPTKMIEMKVLYRTWKYDKFLKEWHCEVQLGLALPETVADFERRLKS